MSNLRKFFGGRRLWATAFLVASVAAPSNAETWTQLFPSGGPPAPRGGHSAVYDAGSNRMTVFGGVPYHTSGNPTLYRDVWVLSNADGTEASAPTWTQLSPTGGGPSGRGGHTAVYDPGANRMIVFGGDPNVGSCWGRTNEVWVLENANGEGGAPHWVQLSPTGGLPSPRALHSAVYDPSTNRMVVFGGNNACENARTDVWVLEHANGLGGTPNWSELTPAGEGPPVTSGGAAGGHSAVYDPSSNRMTVFWGLWCCGNDAYVLEHANGLGGTPNWTLLTPAGARPGAGAYQTAVREPAGNRLILFGGFVDGLGWSNDLWSLTHANGLGGAAQWLELSPDGSLPAARSSHTAVLNPSSGRMVVFAGGTDGANLDDVWVLSGIGGGANLPPVADAGPNQSIHAGQAVTLDGSGSSDDQTATEDLFFAWAFASTPPGSTALLVGSDTVNPGFVADLPGDFVIGLVVTDEGGLSSPPDEVIVSSLNSPPTADAGPDQGSYVGDTVALDGTGSTDADFDPLSFTWALSAAPPGSVAELSGADGPYPTLVPDLTGTYILSLVVNDGYADSDPDEVNIAVITAEQYAEVQTVASLNSVAGLPPESVTTKGNRKALSNSLLQVLKALEKEDVDKAMRKLEDALERVDGCALRGTPDLGGGGGGRPPARDYVNNCADQGLVYPMLAEALGALTP